jgi:hypothetical protein
LEKEPLPESPLIELGRRQRNASIPSEKPFDVLAEGLISQQSRGDCMAFELFVRGVEAWEDDVKRLVMAA